MRTSIKMKFSLFLLILLLLTVILLRIFILDGIRENQKMEYEGYLRQQTDLSEAYLRQSFLSSEELLPEAFLKMNASDLTQNLASYTGQETALFSLEGTLLSPRKETLNEETLKELLPFALEGKTLYRATGDDLFYLTPLSLENHRVGILAFYYSLRNENSFYESTASRFLYVGASVFLVAFLIAYLYFRSYATDILKLNTAVEKMESGTYAFQVSERSDEIGSLSRGVFHMGQKIKTTLEEMRTEEEKLQEAVTKLEILGKQQKEFIGAVTHEFKTPLTSVRAYLDLLSMYPEDPVLLKKALPAIEEETRRLYDMVEKTLELSRLEHYAPHTALSSLKLTVLLEEVLHSLKGKIEKFGLTLIKEVEDIEILGDREALLIVLMNLLDNAIKYNKPQGMIFIRVYPEEHLGILQLEDTGIGIPMDLSQRIFDPFYTIDKNRSRETGGVGLGLSLAKKYTELQGGTLTLLASSEEGTAFQLSFPLSATLEDDSSSRNVNI